MQLVMVSTAWGVERPFLDWDALEKARALVDEHWGAVADLSDALLRDGEVRSQDVHEILEAAECRSNPFRAMARAVDRRLPRIKEWW